MLFYVRIIKPYVYFNAMAYIASRKITNEEKAQADLSQTLNATVDFAGNNNNNDGSQKSSSKLASDLNYPTDQGGFDNNGSFRDPMMKNLLSDGLPMSPDQAPSEKSKDSFIDENDCNLGYTKRPRNYGDGEIRIGTYLSLNEDIYSLGFASLAKNEIIDEALLKDEASRP